MGSVNDDLIPPWTTYLNDFIVNFQLGYILLNCDLFILILCQIITYSFIVTKVNFAHLKKGYVSDTLK